MIEPGLLYEGEPAKGGAGLPVSGTDTQAARGPGWGAARTVRLAGSRRRVRLALRHASLVQDAPVVAVDKRVAKVEPLVVFELLFVARQQPRHPTGHPREAVRPVDANRPARAGVAQG